MRGAADGLRGVSVNRRGFISVLVGAAGAPLVPWRGLVEPTIFLPPKETRNLGYARYLTDNTAWFIKPGRRAGLKTFHRSNELSEASLEAMCIRAAKIRLSLSDVVSSKELRMAITPFGFYGTRGL